MGRIILEAEEIEFAYPDGSRALRGVSMALEEGKKAAVLGPNGAGKTTLFLHLNGLLRPQKGKLRFAGAEVRYNRASLNSLRQNVGIVFQDPDSQLFSASVLQEISFGPLNLGLGREEALERVEEAAAAAGVEDLLGRPTHFLSYGQKKRVAIADVLAMRPAVLILDEPTAFLEPGLALRLMELLGGISRMGKTVVLSTHDVDLAYAWADYVFVLAGGRVAGQGTPEEVFGDPGLLARTGLARPWLLDLSEELRERGWLAPDAPCPRSKEELWALLPRKEL